MPRAGLPVGPALGRCPPLAKAPPGPKVYRVAPNVSGHADGILNAMTWASLPRKARAFRVFHAVYSVFGLSAFGYLWACVFTGRRDRGLAASIGFLLVEGAALIMGRGNCPMGPVQEEWGDPVPFFELVLPPRAAKAAVPVLAWTSALGIVLIVLRGPRRGRPPKPSPTA